MNYNNADQDHGLLCGALYLIAAMDCHLRRARVRRP